jgi:hypothetical protein
MLRRLPKANLDNIAALFRLLKRLGRYTSQETGQCPVPKANQGSIASLFSLLNRLGKYTAQETAWDNHGHIAALSRLLNRLGTLHCSGDCPRPTRTVLLLCPDYSTG